MRAESFLAEERLITRDGTVIPQAVRFADGTIIVCYHVGNDAYFSPSGASISRDNGRTWLPCASPLHRTSCMGAVGDTRALWFDQYLWKVGRAEYACFYNETRDGGATFAGPRLARFQLDRVIDKRYAPRPHDDPDYFYEPDIPPAYRSVTDEHGAVIGAYVFGTVLRLPDGVLGLSAYARVEGNMTRRPMGSTYASSRSSDGRAPEATAEALDSSLFFRSEDEGATWRCAGTIGKVRPGRPFDAGEGYSEGLNETGMACTREGHVIAMMRHGSNMLLWYAVSEDGGRTWGDILPMNYPGVAPCMARMANGVLAAAWGRPGITVGFNLDGSGRRWDVLVGVLSAEEKSQDYPWITPVAEDRLMVFYDRRRWDPQRRTFYDHGIYRREIGIK